MKRILERHDDVGTMGIVLYTDDITLFKDAACKEGLTVEELTNIKFHPLMVDVGTKVYRVVSVGDNLVCVMNRNEPLNLHCIDAEVPE